MEETMTPTEARTENKTSEDKEDASAQANEAEKQKRSRKKQDIARQRKYKRIKDRPSTETENLQPRKGATAIRKRRKPKHHQKERSDMQKYDNAEGKCRAGKLKHTNQDYWPRRQRKETTLSKNSTKKGNAHHGRIWG